MASKTTGLVLGKFMPLHQGHVLLLEFARNFVDTLYVVVDNIPGAPIAGEIRCDWVRKTVPDAQVFYITEPKPQAPEDHPDFWSIWQHCLIATLPQKPDFVFASEHYGSRLAEVLGSEFVPLDINRETISVSATKIRENPMKHWDYLSAAAKLHYLKRVCVFGPESTGKTTLVHQLARYFNTAAVPEYARLFMEAKRHVTKSDLLSIAKGQTALEEAMAPRANRILFCDTDALATTLWSTWLFHECSPAITALALARQYDLYLLTAPDLAWEPDAARFFPHGGQKFFEDCVEILEKHQRRYAIVSGHGPDRFDAALNAVTTRFAFFR